MLFSLQLGKIMTFSYSKLINNAENYNVLRDNFVILKFWSFDR